jgi:exodeoxyribonuclease VII large subunit
MTQTDITSRELVFAEFTPGTLQQYIDLILNRLVKENLPEIAGMVRLRGRLTDPGKVSGKMHYNVKIVDDGGAQAKADIPASLLSGRGIVAGHQVVASGVIVTRATAYGVEVKLSVADIQLSAEEAPVTGTVTDQGRMTLDRLRGIRMVRNEFPAHDTITVALIQSTSAHAQVSRDCLAELDKLGNVLVINPIQVNMLDPVAITKAIAQADADLLIMIRGGGDSGDFEVFDDPRVVQALSNQTAHRVMGLGHSGNATLLDLVADYSANTPAQAGGYVRERIERRQRLQGDMGKDLRLARERMESLEKERNTAQAQAKSATDLLEQVSERAAGFPLWAVAVAFVIGAVAAWLIR